jgi:hypothetical protein
MSSALSKFIVKQIRAFKHEASDGADLAYNEMIENVLPSIVSELEEKILELYKKIDQLSNLKTKVCKCECWEGCQDVKTYDDSDI